MSHDRGCFRCFGDPSEYANCEREDCPKHDRFAVEPGGDKSDAPPRPLSAQERAQFPREAVLEAEAQRAFRELAKRGTPGLHAERRVKGVVEVDGELREHNGRALGQRVRHESGEVTRIITVTEPGYDVALFMTEDGGAEAVISRPGLSPTGVNIAPPAPGRRIVIERTGQKFEVVYKDVPK